MGKVGRRDPPSILPHVVVAKCGCGKKILDRVSRTLSPFAYQEGCSRFGGVTASKYDRTAKFVITFELDRESVSTVCDERSSRLEL
jgi:hypothetical protein